MQDQVNLSRPIFIVGPGRSGTTLLRGLLSAHSRIAVTPETHFMARADAWGLRNGAPKNFEAFWTEYIGWLRFRDLGVDATRCRELIDRQNEYSFASTFRAVLSAYQECAGKARVGEKTPGHSAYLSTLLDWFPDARILFTQRDPRAVVASQLKTAYVRKKMTTRSLRHGLLTGKREEQIIFYARQWFENFEKFRAPWQDDSRVYTVVYEDLVRDTESEFRSICAFLEEDFEASALSDRRGESVPIHAARDSDPQMEQWRREHHNKSVAPITSDSLTKWKSELTPREVALIEACCKKPMIAKGYSLSTSKHSLAIAKAAASSLAFSGAAEARMRSLASRPIRSHAKQLIGRAIVNSVARGAPPGWFGYRHVIRETVQDYFRRNNFKEDAGSYETVHREAVAVNPLPKNISARTDLPDDRGWWGYSFRDVPERVSGETYIATLPDCLVTWYLDPLKDHEFYPAIINKDSRAIDMREIRFRPLHGKALRESAKPVRIKQATWFAERVYHNYSHWLTAHLPKLLLLRERGLLDQLLLPPERSTALDSSLRMLGLNPDAFPSWDPSRPLFVEQLTVVGTDRFRPELLKKVPQAFGVPEAPEAQRKIFISRMMATRRKLVNESEVWSLLEPFGFERVNMEELSFSQQVELMQQTSILAAPHGAGLTNMIFCPAGAHIIEIADLGFPNPNFYALAAAMGHNYWLAQAESVGDVHPLEKDLKVDPAAVEEILHALLPGHVPAGETYVKPKR